jgi:hypothetical protein
LRLRLLIEHLAGVAQAADMNSRRRERVITLWERSSRPERNVILIAGSTNYSSGQIERVKLGPWKAQ